VSVFCHRLHAYELQVCKTLSYPTYPKMPTALELRSEAVSEHRLTLKALRQVSQMREGLDGASQRSPSLPLLKLQESWKGPDTRYI
jgi:hypothetical protein